MQRFIITFTFIFLFLFAPHSWTMDPINKETKLCENNELNGHLCSRMRHLRSHIMLLGEQRDLMQVNYSLLSSIGQSMEDLVNQLMTSKEYESHLDGIEIVRDTASELVQLAQKEKSEAFETANTLRSHCTQCHSNPAPGRSVSWHALSRISWETITNRCNEVGRNPHLCKNMYGMVSAISYFRSASDLENIDFKLAYESAKELARVASYIQGFRTHADTQLLTRVEQEAKEIMILAESKDASYLEKGYHLTNSCFNCHK